MERLEIVVEDFDSHRQRPDSFMLDDNEIFRYDMVSNSWKKRVECTEKSFLQFLRVGQRAACNDSS